MKDWPPLPPDEELERADDLLGQANALLSRHRTGWTNPLSQRHDELADAAPEAFTPFGAGLEDEDLPILTEVVDDLDLPPGWNAPPTAPPSAPQMPPPMPAAPTSAPDAPLKRAIELDASPLNAPAITLEDRIAYQIAERLVELDTQIARSIGDWMETEFPQLLRRELDHLGERLQAEMRAHLRATLLPELSARISEQMDLTPSSPPKD